MLVVFRLAPTASILPLCEAFHCGKFCINNGLREIRSLRATCCRVHLLHKIVDTCCWLYHPPHYVAIEIYPKYLRYIFMYIHMYINIYVYAKHNRSWVPELATLNSFHLICFFKLCVCCCSTFNCNYIFLHTFFYVYWSCCAKNMLRKLKDFAIHVELAI